MIRTALHVLFAAVGEQLVDSLKKKYPDIADEIQEIADEDPTKGGKQTYLKWVVERIKNGMPSGWSPTQIVALLEDLYVVLKYMETKDINRFKSFDALLDAVNEADERAEEDKEENQPGLLHDGGDHKIWSLKNRAQVCRVGKGSKWCVSMKDSPHWDGYGDKKDGSFILVEDFGAFEDGEKYLAFLVDDVVGEIKNWGNSEFSDAADLIIDAGHASDYDPDVMEPDEEDLEETEVSGELTLHIGFESFRDDYEDIREDYEDLPEEITPEMETQMEDYADAVLRIFNRDLRRNGWDTGDLSGAITNASGAEARVSITVEGIRAFFGGNQNFTRDRNSGPSDWPQTPAANRIPSGVVRFTSFDEYGEYGDTSPEDADWLNCIDFYARFDMDDEYEHLWVME